MRCDWRLHVSTENVSWSDTVENRGKGCALRKLGVTTTFAKSWPIMNYRVSYKHNLESAPYDYIARVPSRAVEEVPANLPAALLPEYVTDFILKHSTRIGKLRHLRIR